jgi:hypothetical protein
MGRINQAENRRYDQIQAQNVGIRNQADLTNLGFQQQETMYGKQAAGKKQNFLAEGLTGTAGLAQNSLQRSSMDSKYNNQLNMDMIRLQEEANKSGYNSVEEYMRDTNIDPYMNQFAPERGRRGIRNKNGRYVYKA